MGNWIKYGCGGCLAVVAVIALVIGVVLGVVSFRIKSEKVEQSELAPDLPVVVQPAPVAGVEPTATPAPPAVGSTVGLPGTEPTRGVRRGRVKIDAQQGGFIIEAAPPGGSLRVLPKYDRTSYELIEQMDTHAEGDIAWTYELRFRQTGSWVLSALKAMMGGTPTEIRVQLPLDVPIDLEIAVAQGGAQMQLGGLWLTDLKLDLTQGGFAVGIDRPLREPVERIQLNGKMGGMAISGIGNASPRQLVCDFSMGGLELDLGGAWQRDAEIRLTANMAGGKVRLPKDVRIEGVPSQRIEPLPSTDLPVPTLRFVVSASSGELEFE